MRRFAANYVITEAGTFLKNGIAVINDEGLIAEYIDTKGNLRETEQLIFQNGIILAETRFSKTNSSITLPDSDLDFQSIVFQSIEGKTQFLVQDVVDLGKQLQVQFPEMKIPEIINEITTVLCSASGFKKETIPGIYLLIGTDLVGLHFTPSSKLKKIL